MKLLVMTQAVDQDDPILGFFHAWLQGFATRVTHLTVVGQRVGRHALSSTTTIISLGKEQHVSRPAQILRFWHILIARRHSYDVIFVHMTPVWIVLAWPVAVLLRKPLYLWYEARGGGIMLRIATCMTRAVFGASDQGMPFRTSKRITTGHGIDTTTFAYGNTERDPMCIVSVGRITASKQPERIIDALEQLPVGTVLHLVGEPRTSRDAHLLKRLQAHVDARGLMKNVVIGPMPPSALPALLQRATLFLHASQTALDKAVLEAMACGCLVVSCADAVRPMLPSVLRAPDALSLGHTAQQVLSLAPHDSAALRQQLRQVVLDHHSLPRLLDRLVSVMS